MSTYKGFEINTSSTPAPWGDREERMVKAVIDTLTVDTLQGTSATSGHSHNKLYSTSGGTVQIHVTSAGNVSIGNINLSGGKVHIQKNNYIAQQSILCLEDLYGGNYLINFKNQFVNHGISNFFTSGVHGVIAPAANGSDSGFGGLTIMGISDGTSEGISLHSFVPYTDPSYAYPAIYLDTHKKNGTGVKALGATDKVFEIDNNGGMLLSISGNGSIGISTGGDIYTSPLINYFSSSTKSGWSSYTKTDIYCKKVGKSVDVYFDIAGPSNNVGASFTVPYTASTLISNWYGISTSEDNSGTEYGSRCYLVGALGTTIHCLKTYNSGTADNDWTTSGTKRVRGHLRYEVD